MCRSRSTTTRKSARWRCCHNGQRPGPSIFPFPLSVLSRRDRPPARPHADHLRLPAPPALPISRPRRPLLLPGTTPSLVPSLRPPLASTCLLPLTLENAVRMTPGTYANHRARIYGMNCTRHDTTSPILTNTLRPCPTPFSTVHDIPLASKYQYTPRAASPPAAPRTNAVRVNEQNTDSHVALLAVCTR